MRILLAGGTGFLGQPLVRRLVQEKHQVIILTRNPDHARSVGTGQAQLERWDARTVGPWAQRVEESDAVINLAGESLGAGRWTEARKARIINSRVEATRAIVSAIEGARKRPRVLINAGAVGYYGHVESEVVTESHPKGADFLANVVARWEEEASVAEAYGVRVVRLRMGIVLEKDGGALKRMMLPFKFFVGGTLGSGRQWLPWIHRDDVLNIILFALEHTELSGPMNLAAPEPVTMKEFCRALGKAMRRPSWVPVPPFLLRIALGEMADMVLTGQRAVPSKLEAAGYKFLYPRLDGALRAIFHTRLSE